MASSSSGRIGSSFLFPPRTNLRLVFSGPALAETVGIAPGPPDEAPMPAGPVALGRGGGMTDDVLPEFFMAFPSSGSDAGDNEEPVAADEEAGVLRKAGLGETGGPLRWEALVLLGLLGKLLVLASLGLVALEVTATVKAVDT